MGLTRIRAEQISDIDYKQAVRVITVTNVTLSGGAPNTVDGITLVAGDRILVAGQNTASQNGLYDVATLGTGSNGTWSRTVDGDVTGEIQAGMIVMVTEGDVYKDTQWKLTTNNPIVIGTTALTFEQNSAFAFGNIFANGTAVLANTVGSTVTLTAGDNIAITGNNTTKTVTIGVTGISLNSISNGTSNVNVVSSGGNVTMGIGGTSNISVFSTAGVDVTGRVSATGNVTGGNVTTAGVVTATGNVTGGNINTAGIASAGGNVVGANIRTAGVVTATGNVTGGNINTAGVVSATGSVYGLELHSTQSSGDEGGQINLSIPATNTSLTGPVVIDIYQNRLRFFQATNAKGAFIDLTAAADGVGSNLLASSGGGGTPGGSNTFVQFNDGGSFGGNGQFVYNKVTNTLTVGIVSANNNGNGTNFQVGDDAWIGDINLADTISIRGQQNAANAFIIFGNADSTAKLGRAGSGPLTYVGAFSASGNVTGGNLTTSGLISATGNITGSYILGNGSQLTGIDATSIQSGTSNVRVVSSGGNVAAGIGGTSNVLVIASTGTFVTGIESVTGNITGANLNTAGVVSATGNVTTGANLVLASNIIDTGALEIITSSNGNITLSPNGSGLIVANKDIRNGQANGVGNIGTTGAVFNTIFAKATSAQYADVAEKYVADRVYPAGTVLEIGGAAEVEETTTYASTRIAGVVSTNPALIMNSGEQDTNAVEVALLGRVPCRVTGTIRRGDLMTSSDRPGVATALSSEDYKPGCVIGKALQGHAGDAEGVIEILVGRL